MGNANDRTWRIGAGELAILLVLGGCAKAEISKIQIPVPPNLDVLGFSRVLVAGFVPDGGDQIDPALNVANRGSSLEAQSRSNGYADAEVNAAVNQLFASLNPSLAENHYFPEFAKEKLSWIITEQKAGRLSLMLLKNLANTNLDVENLMAAGRVEGKGVIVIARPRFVAFLVEGVSGHKTGCSHTRSGAGRGTPARAGGA